MEAYLSGFAAHVLPVFCIFLAAFLQSLTGFGLVIVAAPLLMLFYDAKLVVPIMLLLACCGNLVQGLMYCRQANWPLVLVLYLGVLVGQPFGFFVFDAADNTTLKLMISVLLLFSLMLMQMTHRSIEQNHRNSFLRVSFPALLPSRRGWAGRPSSFIWPIQK